MNDQQVARIPSDRLQSLTANYNLADGRKIEISGGMVMRYLVQGKWELIEEAELVYFLKTCQALQLDPFIKECYLIKYSAKGSAAIVVAAQTFRDRAIAHPLCVGWDKGLILYQSEAHEIVRTSGVMLPEHKLVGAWFQARPKGWEKSYKHEVNLSGYVQKDRNGNVTKFWSEPNQPSQIMKVVEAQGLRQIFGTSLRGLYVAAEILHDDEGLPSIPVDAADAKVETDKAVERSKDLSMYEDKEGQVVSPDTGKPEEDAPMTATEVKKRQAAGPPAPEHKELRYTCADCGLAYAGLPAYTDVRGDVCEDCAKEVVSEAPGPEEPPGIETDADAYAEAKGRAKETPEQERKRLEKEAAEADVSKEEGTSAAMELELFGSIGTLLKKAALDERLIGAFQDHLRSVARTTHRPLGSILADTANDIEPMLDGFGTLLKRENYLGMETASRTVLLKLMPKQDPKADRYDPCRWANFSLLKTGLSNHLKLHVRAFLKDENLIPRQLAKRKWSKISDFSQQAFPLDKYEDRHADATVEQLQRVMAQMKGENPDLFKAAIKNQGLMGRMFSEFEKKDFLNVIKDIEEQKELRAGAGSGDPTTSGF